MDAPQIESFLQKLGSRRIRVGLNGWVHASCPLAPWLHKKGHDDHPSFGISVAPGGRSVYRCHGCNSSGDLNSLMWRLESLSKRKFPELVAWLQEANTTSLDVLKKRLESASYFSSAPKEVAGIQISSVSLGYRDPDDLEPKTLPEEELVSYRKIPSMVWKYLTEGRKLSRRAIQDWELGWDAKAGKITLPVRDCKGRLVGISRRLFRKSNGPKYMHSKGFKRDFYLFGEHKLVEGQVGYLVEGHFDAIALWDKGYPNAVAMMGSHISKMQVEKIVKFFNKIVIVPDGDPPGFEAADRAELVLGARLPVSRVKTPEGMDPADMSLNLLMDLLGCDPQVSP